MTTSAIVEKHLASLKQAVNLIEQSGARRLARIPTRVNLSPL
jgi:hypothetical protein